MEPACNPLLATAHETLTQLDEVLTPLGPEAKAKALHLVISLLMQTLVMIRGDIPELARAMA